MDLAGAGALIAGGSSGLGAATARALAGRGACVAIMARDAPRAEAFAAQLGAGASSFTADVTREAEVETALAAATEWLGDIRVVISCAGTGWAARLVGREGPMDLDAFETIVRVNLVGSFNLLRLAASRMLHNDPDAGGERGVVVLTASTAAWDGQIGQAAYAASKGGVVSLTLPAARELSRSGIRVCTIAPGMFDTPLLERQSHQARDALAAEVPFPSRLGDPSEFAALACHIAENPMLNGETIRLDGGLRMPPK